MSVSRFAFAIMISGSLFLASCGAQPHHAQTRIETAAQVIVRGGPVGAAVKVDGLEVWRLQGRNLDKFPVSSGSHTLVISDGGSILYSRTLFIQNGTQKVISLN